MKQVGFHVAHVGSSWLSLVLLGSALFYLIFLGPTWFYLVLRDSHWFSLLPRTTKEIQREPPIGNSSF